MIVHWTIWILLAKDCSLQFAPVDNASDSMATTKEGLEVEGVGASDWEGS